MEHDKIDYLPITAEQGKLLESALRIKILHVLADEPKTSKQVADLLQKTPGNVHYHIQKLLNGGLLELVQTREVKGVVEKYYRSKGTMFRAEQFPEFLFTEQHLFRLGSRLLLSETEREQFGEELAQLLQKWEAKKTTGDEYGVMVTMGKVAGEIKESD